MAINIKQRNSKWRIEINEDWEFKTKQDFERCLKQLVNFKAKNGQLGNWKNRGKQ